MEAEPPEERREQQKRSRDSPRSWGQHDQAGGVIAVSCDSVHPSASHAKKHRPPADDGEGFYPEPLTHEHFKLVLQNGNFSTDDFISFIKCYTCYSQTLSEVFSAMAAATAAAGAERRQSYAGSSPEEEDGMDLVGDDHPSLPTGDGREIGAWRQSNANESEGRQAMEEEQSKSVRGHSQGHISHEAISRNDARRQEALSRRCWNISGPEGSKLGQYLTGVIRDLRQCLDPIGKQQLVRSIAEYLVMSDVQIFARRINDIVDEHQVVVQLPYTTARHGPYTRHVRLAEERRSFEQKQNAMRCALDAGQPRVDLARRIEETGMLPNLLEVIPNAWTAAAYDSGMQHQSEGGGGQGIGLAQGQLHASIMKHNTGTQGSVAGGSVSCFWLQGTRLSQFLTQKVSQACTSNKEVIVKVLADTQHYNKLPRSPEVSGLAVGQHNDDGVRSARGEELAVLVPYRRKMISLFLSSPGVGEILIFVMYVKEYGSDCPSECASQAWIECVDSTPLYEGHEDGKQRQDILTATMLGYLEWAKLRGFREAWLNSPAPADDRQYIFAYRSLNVRVRTSSHFSTWYQRLLAKGMSSGVVHGYRTKSQLLLDLSSLVQGEGASHVNASGVGSNIKDRKIQRESNSPGSMFLNGSGNGGSHQMDVISGTDSTNGNSNSSNSPSSGSGDDVMGGGSNSGDADQHSNLNGNGSNDNASNGSDSCANSQVGRSGGSSEETSSQQSGDGTALNTTTWFVVALQDPAQEGLHECSDEEPVMPSLISSRDDLVKMMEREQLRFHNLKFAQSSTRRLLEVVLQDQQVQHCLPSMFGERVPIGSHSLGQASGVMNSMQAGIGSLSHMSAMRWMTAGFRGGAAGGLGLGKSRLGGGKGNNAGGGFHPLLANPGGTPMTGMTQGIPASVGGLGGKGFGSIGGYLPPQGLQAAAAAHGLRNHEAPQLSGYMPHALVQSTLGSQGMGSQGMFGHQQGSMGQMNSPACSAPGAGGIPLHAGLNLSHMSRSTVGWSF